MNVKRQLRAEFWPVGQKPVDCTVSREEDGRVRFSSIAGSCQGLLVLKTQDSRRYGLGEFHVTDRVAERPRPLASAPTEDSDLGATMGSNLIDSSAARRLNSLLQKAADLRLELKLPSGTVALKTVPMTGGSMASLFMAAVTEGTLPESLDNVPAVLFLFGMQYVFRAHIVEASESEVAISLPASYCRIVRRAVLRDSAALKVRVNAPGGEIEAMASDVSYSGLCVGNSALSMYEIWTELELSLPSPDGSQLVTHALIVEQSEKGTHLLFCGGTSSVKQRFRLLHRILNEGTELVEDPELVWSCLERFDYLDLLDPEKLLKVKDDCIAIWRANGSTDLSLLPVLQVNGQSVGTYGSFEGGIQQWYHHLLAIDFSPKSLTHSAMLYQVWPNYLSSRFESCWITAWYNPAKTWHNRFCQVFLKEHEKHSECVTFDRHWFWLSQIDTVELPSAPTPGLEFLSIDEAPSQLREEAFSKLRTWYPKLDSAAVLPKSCRTESKESAGRTITHKEYNLCIRLNGSLIGCLLLSYTTQDLNPFSLTNAGHLNIFDPAVKNSPELLKVIRESIRRMKELGYHRAAFTLDFDAPIESVKEAGFTYFAVQRCISFTSRLLPEWLSNSALSFADLTGRTVA